jgi:hypothetical protein
MTTMMAVLATMAVSVVFRIAAIRIALYTRTTITGGVHISGTPRQQETGRKEYQGFERHRYALLHRQYRCFVGKCRKKQAFRE